MAKLRIEEQKYKVIDVEDLKRYLTKSEQASFDKLLNKVYEGIEKDGRHYKHYEVIVKAINIDDLVE